MTTTPAPDPPARLMCLGDCGYPLTTPLARARGYGHRCWDKLPAAVQAAISLRIPARPRARRATGQLEITDPTEETRLMPDQTPPTTPADDAAELDDAQLDHLVHHARFCRSGCEASFATERLVEEIRRLRRQLDAAEAQPAEVWLCEKDGNEPKPWTSLEAAQADCLASWDDTPFTMRWREEEDGGYRLYADDTWTHSAVWREPVLGTTTPEPGPLESAVTEARADIAADPADPEPAPIRHAWLIEAGDD